MRIHRPLLMATVVALILMKAAAGQFQANNTTAASAPNIEFLGQFQSPADVEATRTPCQHLRDFFDHSGQAHDVSGERPAFCDKIVDVALGKAVATDSMPEQRLRIAKIATDPHGRIVMTEPGTRSVHILDFTKRKYQHIDGSRNNVLLHPNAVAIDGEGDIFITDLKLGMIARFDSGGKFKNYIGDFKGERAFEQPNSIAIDRATGRIFLADASRQFVFIYDKKGKKLASIGKRGGGIGPAEFRVPTELTLHGGELFVLDKRNARVQVFDLDGHYRREFKIEALGTDTQRGIAVDAAGRVYFLLEVGQVAIFSPRGELISKFGTYGGNPGEFREPRGMYIDSNNRLYVADPGNQRVQVFRITDQTATRTSTASAR